MGSWEDEMGPGEPPLQSSGCAPLLLVFPVLFIIVLIAGSKGRGIRDCSISAPEEAKEEMTTLEVYELCAEFVAKAEEDDSNHE